MRTTLLTLVALGVLVAALPSTPAAQTGDGPATPAGDGLDALRAEHRSARTAVIMTFPVPGWGQLYADSPFWSTLAFGAEMFYLGSILMENRRQERQRVKRDQETDPNLRATRSGLVDEHGEKARDFVWWAAGVYLIISLDAYVSVELADFDSDIPPTPDLDRDWEREGEDGGGMALQLNFSF
jgi:hypothetical protein